MAGLVVDLSEPTELDRVLLILASEPPDILINLAGVMHFGFHDRRSNAALSRGFVSGE